MITRTHWHASRIDNSLPRDTRGSVVSLGPREGFGTRALAQGVTETDKVGLDQSVCDWYIWPCTCEVGSKHHARVDSAVWCNLNS